MSKFAKELLFFLLAVIIGLPVGFLFIYLLDLQPAGLQMTKDESVWELELYIVGVVLGIVGAYLARLVSWALKKLILDR